MRHPVIAWTLALGLAALQAPAAEPPVPLSIDAALRPDASGRMPIQHSWSPDGKRLTYVWDAAGDGKQEALWSLEPATGRRETLVRFADLGQGKDGFRPSAYIWSPRGDALLLVGRGDLYLLPLDSRKPRRLTSTEEDEETPTFSPDGARIAFVRSFDLYILEVASGKETRLTQDGKESAILNGTTSWVYWEEIWEREPEAFWWSPDGSRLAYYRFDESPVGAYPLLDESPVYPEVKWQKYPKAGETNPGVKIGVIELASGRTTWLETGDPESYLARAAWTPQGDAVAVQRLNRDQTQLDLLRCSAADGACSTLLTETWPTWINLGRDFHFLPDGRFLWGSERSGWRRLYLYEAAGRLLRPLTPEGWNISSLEAVADDGSWAVVVAFPTSELGALDRKVARVRLESGGWDVLTPEPGNHQAMVSAKTGSMVHTWSDANTPLRADVRPAGGGAPLSLPAGEPAFDAAALPRWEFLTILGPDGVRLPAALLKPAGFDASRRYPVIIYHYGLPGSQIVANGWGIRGLWHKLMAQRGFAVFAVEYPASIYFGKPGEDRDHRTFGPNNLSAQLAGVEFLKSLPWVDATRLGLWGWSGGGANTLFCLVKQPGIWRAGVAGAPVTDWKLYDTIWTERYLDRPQDNREGYRESSPLTFAANLADRLLIVHGLADDNVHPQNTAQISGELIRAGKHFEQAVYPGQKHAFRGVPLRHFYERMAEFFERELKAPAGGEGKAAGSL